MTFKESVFLALENPALRFAYRFSGFILLLSFLAGAGVLLRNVFLGGDLQDYRTVEVYWGILLWLMLLVCWFVVYRISREYERLLDSCIVRSVPVIPDRLDFDPKKWDRGFNSHFDQEFTKWELTEAEKEVGLLLLTGMSQEEIAQFRSTTLKTVKNQSTVIYEKAQVKNGKELMSYFIQKLLPSNNDNLNEGNSQN